MTPKEKFLTLPDIRSDWERITQTKAAEVAMEAALLQFVHEQPDGAEAPGAAWDQHSQLVGAKKVLRILFNLHLKEQPVEPMKLTRLPTPR